MPAQIYNPQSPNGSHGAGSPNTWSVGLKWAARCLFVAAALAAAHGFWLRRSRPAEAHVEGLRQAPVSIAWTREEWATWESAEDGIRVRHPARYDTVRGFGRFTSRDIEGGIFESDVVAFRSNEPRSVITIAAYKAPKPLSWEEWTALAKAALPAVPARDPRAPTPLAAEFGGSDRAFRTLDVAGRPMLAVTARGPVRYPLRGNDRWEMWHFESRLVAEGDRAIRITAGVHVDQHAGARQGLERTLESCRWNGSRAP